MEKPRQKERIVFTVSPGKTHSDSRWNHPICPTHHLNASIRPVNGPSKFEGLAVLKKRIAALRLRREDVREKVNRTLKK